MTNWSRLRASYQKIAATTNHPIITNPIPNFPTIPAVVPTNVPQPDFPAGKIPFPPRISPTTAPTSGPTKIPISPKNKPTTAPKIPPIAPHRVAPNHFAPSDPLTISSACATIASTINAISVDQPTTPTKACRRIAPAKISTVPGINGTTVPANPTNIKNTESVHQKISDIAAEPAPIPVESKPSARLLRPPKLSRPVMKFCLLLLAFALPLAAQTQPTDPTPGGFLASATQVLPPQYRNGIVKVSADDGNPNPETWYLLARNADKANDTYAIEIEGGAVTKEKPSFNLGAVIGQPSSIDLSRVAIDSSAAWDIAATFSETKGRQLGTVSYVLEQEGASAAPIWSVWCYDPAGDDIGELRILATNGAIISSE